MQHNFTFQPLIQNLIPKYSRVLDLGCGDGQLLSALIKEKSITGYGVEMNIENIKSCISKNIPVYQGQIEDVLTHLGSQSYDFVILSQTLQEIYDPIPVIKHVIRIGKQGIVTFPNFAHINVRWRMIVSGRSPMTSTLPYEWYNTPNIRVLTFTDFFQLCAREHIKLKKVFPSFHATAFQSMLPRWSYNLLSAKGLCVIER